MTHIPYDHEIGEAEKVVNGDFSTPATFKYEGIMCNPFYPYSEDRGPVPGVMISEFQYEGGNVHRRLKGSRADGTTSDLGPLPRIETYYGRPISHRAKMRLLRWYCRKAEWGLEESTRKAKEVDLSKGPFVRRPIDYWLRCFLFGHGRTLLGNCIDCGRKIT